MSISLFSVIILLLVATIGAIEIYRGVVRGFFPTLISLGLMIPSALVALLLAPAMSWGITSAIMNNILRPEAFYQQIVRDFAATDIMTQAGIQLVATLLMSVILFLLLRPVFRFICYCFTMERLANNDCDPGYNREKNSFCYRNNKLLGGITGGVCALVISMIVTCPIIGALRVADEVIDVAETVKPRLWSMTTLTDEDVEMIRELPEDLPGNLLYELGGKYFFDAATKTEVNGRTVYLREELAHVKSLCSRLQDVMPILENPEAVTPAQLEQLKGLRDDMNQIQVVHGAMVDYFAYCARAWLKDTAYFNLSEPQLPSVMQILMDEILQVCATSQFDTLQANATTLLNCYILAFENDVLSLPSKSYDEIILFLERTQLLSKIDAELQKNPGMAHIRTNSVGMPIWGDIVRSRSFEAYRDGFYEATANALNVVKNRHYRDVDDQIAVMNTYIGKALEKSTLNAPEFLRDALATELIYLLNNSPEKAEFTIEDVQAFFKQFA